MQRKIALALIGGLAGFAFGLVSLLHHEGRQVVARWAALMVISFWIAAQLYRERNRPELPRRRWGEGS